MSLNDTPRADRLHIGLFGRRNSGKSSLINALTGQDIAIVSDTPGTTADPVFKSMELHPVGPVVFIDTAGFDDEGELGQLRVKRTEEVVSKTDIGIMVIDAGRCLEAAGAGISAEKEGSCGIGDRTCDPADIDTSESGSDAASHNEEAGGFKDDAASVKHSVSPEQTGADLSGNKDCCCDPADDPAWSIALVQLLAEEKDWMTGLKAKNIPVITVINKCEDLSDEEIGALKSEIGHLVDSDEIIAVSAKSKLCMDQLRKAISESVPEDLLRRRILGDMAEAGSLVLLVMPQDIQAPKGRLILPQVQTIRELLDSRCTTVCTTADGLERALGELGRAPDLIITDSQCFRTVYDLKPESSRLTSFSVLFAAYKGDIDSFVAGASVLDDIADDARVLIAEACTHVPLSEDIGRVKIPNLLRKKFGDKLEIVNVCGNDFPGQDELAKFDLVIHCGACMFNRRHVLSRISQAHEAGVPITNYGIVLAKLTGILDKIEI